MNFLIQLPRIDFTDDLDASIGITLKERFLSPLRENHRDQNFYNQRNRYRTSHKTYMPLKETKPIEPLPSWNPTAANLEHFP